MCRFAILFFYLFEFGSSIVAVEGAHFCDGSHCALWFCNANQKAQGGSLFLLNKTDHPKDDINLTDQAVCLSQPFSLSVPSTMWLSRFSKSISLL